MNFSSENPARILIVDDHAIVRYGMSVLLNEAPDLELCAEAENIDEALQVIQSQQPDAAVIDIVLKDENGLDLIRKIRSQKSSIVNRQSQMPILVMSMHNESTHAEKALRVGAQGYIMKEDADELLVDALRTILSGKLYVSDGIHEKMLRSYIDDENPEEQSGVDSLTEREKEVFLLIGKGLTTKDIAQKLDCSPRTIEVHRAKIKKKLDCDTAAQVVREAVQWSENRP